MSLLKARRIEEPLPYSKEMVKGNFSNSVLNYTVNPTRVEVVNAIAEYCLYSYIYVYEMAQTFTLDTQMKDSLTAMNSILAEMCHEQEIPYYNVKEGYTIIDKGVDYVLTNGDKDLETYIDNTIDIMVEALKEDEVEEISEITEE